MNEDLVIELGDAKGETKAPYPGGCDQDGVNPVRYQQPCWP